MTKNIWWLKVTEIKSNIVGSVVLLCVGFCIWVGEPFCSIYFWCKKTMWGDCTWFIYKSFKRSQRGVKPLSS
jgi:hypothetical protein